MALCRNAATAIVGTHKGGVLVLAGPAVPRQRVQKVCQGHVVSAVVLQRLNAQKKPDALRADRLRPHGVGSQRPDPRDVAVRGDKHARVPARVRVSTTLVMEFLNISDGHQTLSKPSHSNPKHYCEVWWGGIGVSSAIFAVPIVARIPWSN